MFYYIEGKVTVLDQGLAVIDCGGVGYACNASQNTIAGLKLGECTRLYTYLYLRQDIFDLYGFADPEELSCFKMLIGISGVGPKAALAILSIAVPSRLALSIITGDEKLLMQAPGIGKKIAQRIVLELRDKMAKAQLEQPAAAPVTAATTDQNKGINHTQEAVAALMVLGYTQSEVLQAMEGMELAGADAETMIRQCLKKLAAQ